MKSIATREDHRCRLQLVALMSALVVTVGVATGAEPVGGRLLPRDQIARMGLARAWFSQVQLDSARAQVQRTILSGNQLFALTNDGSLHAFDALTGATLWTTTVGNPDHPSLGPTANEEFVAVVNGSTLHVFNRANGEPKIVEKVGGMTGAAPAMSKTYCFVPMLTGKMEAYPMQDQKLPKWFYQSQGRAMTAPRVTDASIVWTTNVGHVYVGNAIIPKASFRVETGSEIVASPAYRVPVIYIATVTGELIAIHEATGAEQWRFAAEFPILRTPAAIGGRVYVVSLKPALYAIDAASGAALWSAPKITQFAAVSSNHAYAVDSQGALVVLDLASGETLDRMPTDGSLLPLVNDQTDRLYLVSKDGKIQCLHEIGAKTPLYHNPPPQAQPTDSTRPQPAAPTPLQPGTPPQGDNPLFDTPAAPTTPATPTTPGRPADDNPFGELGTPAGGGGDNPLGGR